MKGKQFKGFPAREDALKDFFAAWEFEPETELVSLADACGRIVATELHSTVTLPVVRSSGGDGIAVHSADFASGMPDTSAWRPGDQYVRADTGDDFSDEYDAVIMIEEVTIHDDGSIVIEPDVPVSPGCNVNQKGSTIAEGALLIEAHMPIRATDLAALAMGGVTMVPVLKRPVVAFIPTGSELVPAGVKPRRGQNIDTNSLLVPELLREMGAEALVFPIVYDETDELAQAVEQALAVSDMVVINGGTAKGGEDYNYQILGKRGKLIHHYIAAAPGRPLAMAVADGKPLVNLPGPTMAAWFSSSWCLNACVARMLCQPAVRPATVMARCQDGIGAGGPMAILMRMQVSRDENGELVVKELRFKKDMVGALSSNAQRVREIDAAPIAPGEMIEVELLRPIEYVK